MLKKILFVNPTAKMSGAEFSLLSLMAGLDRDRFEPLLLLPDPGPFQEKADAHGIRSIVLPSLFRYDECYRIWKSPRIIRVVLAIRRIIRRERIALVHSNKLGVSYVGGLAARLGGIPALVHIRDGGLNRFVKPWKGRVIRFLNDEIIAVSHATGDGVAAIHPVLRGKVRVIYNGIDMAAMDRIRASTIRGELGIPPSAPLIGAVGRIEPGKGIEVLIAVAKELKSRFPGLRILIVGPVFEPRDKPHFDQILLDVKRRGLEKDIHFTGFRSDVLGIVKELSIVVHPAVFQDPLPRAVLEAAALGKPIVASRVGGVPEILEDRVSGILFEPGNAAALAAALSDLLQDPATASRLGMAARKIVEDRFSVRCHVAEVTAVYEGLLGGNLEEVPASI
ncbi:MAG: glycosyltransferase family 4 protein [Candidatus Aminicenantes bacterium]|nr:glycosyltransferase family 4 protein [Candidatus Aminicenantes bacterium]